MILVQSLSLIWSACWLWEIISGNQMNSYTYFVYMLCLIHGVIDWLGFDANVLTSYQHGSLNISFFFLHYIIYMILKIPFLLQGQSTSPLIYSVPKYTCIGFQIVLFQRLDWTVRQGKHSWYIYSSGCIRRALINGTNSVKCVLNLPI